MIVCGQNFSQELVTRIQETVIERPGISRSELSGMICHWLDWRSANGRFKDMQCRVALLKLERAGVIELPASKPFTRGTKKQGIGVTAQSGSADIGEEAEAIACDLSEIGRVAIVKVTGAGKEVSHTWNEMMNRHHYLGAGPLCGAQMRYLIQSERCGWVGGFAFSAAAWSLQARDEWIGWDRAARVKHLSTVVCNSRFLILPHVHVPHLASHSLSLCIKHLLRDWDERYNIAPVLLETFVERGRFKGTCYQASNWQHIGTTKGRGRQDQTHAAAEPVKDIYVYPLRADAKDILCDGRANGGDSPEPASDWAAEEFGAACLGDQRRVTRLMTIARDFYAQPQATIPQACQSRAKTKAAYRFFGNGDNSMEKILAPHYETTVSRLAAEQVVLAVQDTTSLHYTTHREDLGLIGYRADGGFGLLVHDTMTFTTEGTPLGLLDVQVWTRDPEDYGKKHLRSTLPIEQKESNKWLRSFRNVAEAQKHCPDTTLVCVGDREADMYDLFELAAKTPHGPKLLIRAGQNRSLARGQGYLWEYVKAQRLSGAYVVRIPRKGKQPPREAVLEIRFAKVTLKPPQNKPNLDELEIQAIIAEEVACPEAAQPLHWLLLTTCAITSFEEAIEKVAWYCHRWGIEIYHKTLKSGCKIEERQFGQADSIQACLAVDMVIAWRIFHLAKLGRETPDVPCTVFFEDAQWKALVAYKTHNPIPPENPPPLGEAMRMVASLGGFLGRKCDGNPGTKTLWLGLQRLDAMTEMYKICITMYAPELLHPPPRGQPQRSP